MANALSTFVERIGIPRALIIALGLVTAGVIWGFARWGMAPTYVPIVGGLPLDQMGTATQLLEDADIAYSYERGGTLLTVPDRDAARARVVLASEGLTGTSEGPGFELFDQPAWGMTDFTQRVNYRRALEGELERTISHMRDVESARVHLALQQRSYLRGADQAGEASIVLSLRSGAIPEGSVVEGVQSLVASSVEGLTPTAVTVLDDRGRLLSTPDTEDGSGLTNAQLKVRRQVEEYLEGRAQSLVARIVGEGNASVKIAADLNFDQLARTTQALDPDQQMLMTEDRAEITPGAPEQGAASSTRSQTFEASRSVETLSRGGARLERLSVAVLVGDRETPNPDGTIAYEARTPAELARVESLVASAVGIAPERGDQISVVSAPLQVGPMLAPEDRPFDFTGVAMAAQRPIIALAALGMALFLALRILGTLKALANPRGQQSLTGAPETQAVGAAPPGELPPAPPKRTEVTVSDPEMAARVLRSWMQEA